MREDSTRAPASLHLHWHDGGTCHGFPTLRECASNAIHRGWTGRILEKADTYASGKEAKCYSLIAHDFEHWRKYGTFVATIELVCTLL